MATEEETEQTAVRVPKSWLARLDKIAEGLTEPGRVTTRADAHRMMLHRGMAEFEATAEKKKR